MKYIYITISILVLVTILIFTVRFKKETFKEVFDVNLPYGLKLINEKTHYPSPDLSMYYYWGKFEGSKEAFFELIEVLNLSKSESSGQFFIPTMQSPKYTWWDPPKEDTDINENTYYKYEPYFKENSLIGKTIAKYHEGIIYLFWCGY